MDEGAIRGLRWTFLAVVGGRLFSLIALIVLARLLVPEDFGVIAFALLLSALLSLLATAGIGPSLVVAPSVSRHKLGISLSLLVALRVACALVLVAVSPLAADAIGESDSAGVIAAMGVPLVLRSVTSFYAALWQREFQFGRRAAVQVLDVSVAGVVAVSLAFADAGIWSLVAGQCAGALAGAVASVFLAPDRIRPSFGLRDARQTLRAGYGFVWQSGASFVEQNADYFVVGTMLGTAPLGYYSMAYRLSELPYSSLVDPVAQVTFPGFARMQAREEQTARPFLTLLRVSALCAFPLGLLLSGVADPFVDAVFGPKWAEMAPVLVILGVWGSFRTMHATIAWFVNSLGQADEVGKSYAVLLIFSLPLIIVAGTIGVEAVAVVMTLNVLAMTLLVGNIARRKLQVSAISQWLAVRPSLFGGFAAWAAATAVSAATEQLSPAVSLSLALAAGCSAYLAIVHTVDPGAVAAVRSQLRRVLRKAQPARPVEPSAEYGSEFG